MNGEPFKCADPECRTPEKDPVAKGLCKCCYNRRWKETNKDYGRLWREANKEKYQESSRRWHETNKDRKKETNRRWREANKERERDRSRRWNEANKDRKHDWYRANRNPNREKETRRSSLLRRFGLSKTQYDSILHLQGDSCAICYKRTESLNRRLAVDHCDLFDGTPFVRGLLCITCNTRAGSTREDFENLKRTVAYLERAFEAIDELEAEILIAAAVKDAA